MLTKGPTVVSGGTSPSPSTQTEPQFDLTLLNGFRLMQGDREVSVPASGQRVIAYLALHPVPMSRRRLADALWTDSTEASASTSLRSALWRIRQRAAGSIAVRDDLVRLGDDVQVDFHHASGTARSLLRSEGCAADPWQALALLDGELLPGWSEDWVIFERESVRQLQLHALEALCRTLSAQGRHYEAVEAGLAAAAKEPLRETAHRTLIEAHLSEGNVSEAIRQYERFRSVLHQELGLEPSASLAALIADRSDD